MKLTESVKFWLIFSLILIAAFLGGILGNWVFIYLLDKYYGIPGGNYLASAGNNTVIVRDNKKTNIDQDSQFAQTMSLIDRSLVRIFKKQTDGLYQPQEAIATAIVMTSDGWLMTMTNLAPNKNNSWQDYEVVTYDKRIFAIEAIKFNSLSKVYFIHLKGAQNLMVSNFLGSQNLSTGQSLVSVGLDGSIEIGRLLRDTTTIYSSDKLIIKLPVTGFTNRQAYFYNTKGEIVGLSHDNIVLATNGIEKDLEKLLTTNKISYPRLGIHYLDLNKVLNKEAKTGALITALDKDNPAIIPDSPADKAGLKSGDIITALDDTPINEFNNLTTLLQDYSPGDSIVLTIKRGKENMNITVKLDELISQ